MSEHWPASYIGTSVLAWCNVCRTQTTHRVDAVTTEKKSGKLGPCLEHGPHELTRAQAERRRKQQQRELFP